MNTLVRIINTALDYALVVIIASTLNSAIIAFIGGLIVGYRAFKRFSAQ